MVGRASRGFALATVLATACGETFARADEHNRELETSNTSTDTDTDTDGSTTSSGDELVNTVTSNVTATPRETESTTGCTDESTSDTM